MGREYIRINPEIATGYAQKAVECVEMPNSLMVACLLNLSYFWENQQQLDPTLFPKPQYEDIKPIRDNLNKLVSKMNDVLRLSSSLNHEALGLLQKRLAELHIQLATHYIPFEGRYSFYLFESFRFYMVYRYFFSGKESSVCFSDKSSRRSAWFILC